MMHRNKIAWLKLSDLSGFVRRIVAKIVEYLLPLWFAFDQ